MEEIKKLNDTSTDEIFIARNDAFRGYVVKTYQWKL